MSDVCSRLDNRYTVRLWLLIQSVSKVLDARAPVRSGMREEKRSLSARSEIGSRPFDWYLSAHLTDRSRLLLQKSIIKPINALHLRGGPSLCLLLRRIIGDYIKPLTSESPPDI